MPVVRLRVPATSANLGPGFDSLGLALSLHNHTDIEWEPGSAHEPAEVTIEGEGASDLPRDDSLLTVRALRQGLHALGATVGCLRVHQRNEIPLARGLGSSASALVAGFAAARVVAGLDLDRAWVLDRAAALEGHPDNVAAAVYGGLTVAWLSDDGEARCHRVALPGSPAIAVCVPHFHVSTEEARAVMPASLSRDDAAFSTARSALLMVALLEDHALLLREAVRDRIHTPYRSKLIPCWDELQEAALAAGAAGIFISGSGPTVAAWVPHGDARAVAEEMRRVFVASGLGATALAPSIDHEGLHVK